MPHNRSNRPSDQSSRTSDSERQTRRQRKANLQNSDEVNRNEERLSPTGPKTGGPQRNQTTGSNVPGSEIADRQMSGSESLKQPGDKYTGNSERTGQQYSETEDSSQGKDQLNQESQRKEQPDKSQGTELSGGQDKKSKGMNAPGKQLHETAEVPRKTGQREKKLDDNKQDC